MIYFSETAGGFLDSNVWDIPADGILSSKDERDALIEAAAGRAIVVIDGRLSHAPTPAPSLGILCQSIDSAADTARHQVVGDPLRGEEYKLAAAEAEAFAAAGYPAAEVPRTVAAWVSASRTPQQAADHILAEAAQYNEALYQLRETRLQAKELVRQAMAAGQVEQAQDIAAETIASIEAAVAGVGNNAQ